MKKLFISLTLIAAMLLSSAISVFAAAPTKDGTYEVKIQLRRADSDESSEGSSFLSQTALLEVKNGKKYLTMVSLTSIIGFNLYYYTDGSVSGDTATAEIVKNIEIDGTTYPSGYKIPVKGNSQLVGVMMKLPYISATISGRIYIDYNTCKFIPEPETSAPTDKPETSSGTSENNTIVYEYPYALKPGSNQGAVNDYNYSYSGNSDEESTVSSSNAEKNEKETSETKVVKNVKKKEDNTGIIIGGVILGAILLALVGWVVISKAKESK